MAATSPIDDITTRRRDWRKVLAPWLLAAKGKLTLSLAPANVLPTRADLQKLWIHVDVSSVGCDSGMWCAMLEAMELLPLLFRVDSALCWTLLLEICGVLNNHQRLAIPVEFLHDVVPRFRLCVDHHDLEVASESESDSIDTLMEVLDLLVMGIPKWNYSRTFAFAKTTLLEEAAADDDDDDGKEEACIAITIKFILDEASVNGKDRLEVMRATQYCPAFLNSYQDSSDVRGKEDSPFIVQSMDFEMGDEPMTYTELVQLVGTCAAFPIKSLSFAAWEATDMETRVEHGFCAFALAGWPGAPQFIRNRALENMSLSPTPESDNATILELCGAIMNSQSLRELWFSDAQLVGDRAHPLDGIEWVQYLMYALFSDQSSNQIDTLHLSWTYYTLEQAQAMASCIQAMSVAEAKARDDASVASPAEAAAPMLPAMEEEDEPQPVNSLPTCPQIEIVTDDDAVSSFAAPLPRSKPEQHDCHDESGSDQVLEEYLERVNWSKWTKYDVATVVLPQPPARRFTSHSIRHLTITLNSVNSRGNDDDATALEETACSPQVVIAFLRHIGTPLTRLKLVGAASSSCFRRLTALELEHILTACPFLTRLELQCFELESMDPLYEPSLCGGHLEALVLDRCFVEDQTSVERFYKALGDSKHPLYHSLQDLFLCESDTKEPLATCYHALRMLLKNDRLHRFVLRASPEGDGGTGVASQLKRRFQSFHGQWIVAPLTMAAKIAFLSSTKTFPHAGLHGVQRVLPPLDVEILTHILEFAATPRRRHCAIV